jgi:GntR family transcriptional regulator/MocR family aminotransferase
MRPLSFPLVLDEDARSPLFVRIARAISRDIARGRLKPGDRLPGSRTLAETLGVHRSTVVAAFTELSAQGWVETRPGGATLVARSSLEPTPRRFAPHAELRERVPARTGFDLAPSPVPLAPLPLLPKGALAMWGGIPDLRLVPVELLARAYRRAARRHGARLLGYSRDLCGHARLRLALSELLSSARGLAASADDVLVTRGSQMALDLVARSLVAPGDVVAVEALGYRSAFDVFRRAQAKVVPIALDAQGLRVDALEALTRRTRVRAVYLTPHHQYPTTVMLAPQRRLKLLELARRERIALIEDDYDQEFHYDGRPVLPLASNDPHGNVIYVGTLAKILAPGLRLGFVVGPPPLLARMTDERALIDRQGDQLLECAVAELLEDGEIQRHVRRVRRTYEARRDALCAALDKQFASLVRYSRPAGGLALWAEVDPGLDLVRFQARCKEAGVFFQIGREFTFDGGHVPFARFGYALLDEREIATAVRRMTRCLPRSPTSARSK